MRDNRLLRLPQELGRLEDLHVLDVSGNRYDLTNIFSFAVFRENLRYFYSLGGGGVQKKCDML